MAPTSATTHDWPPGIHRWKEAAGEEAAGDGMNTKLVIVPNRKKLIQPSPGFAKKHLSNFHAELVALCGFGCAYCSSNTGYYLRVNGQKFAAATESQTGQGFAPRTDPSLFLAYSDVIGDLERELAGKVHEYGAGQTLMVSQLTDAFSPELVSRGITAAALRILLERTSFRIRVLTKNAAVAAPEFIALFERYPERIVVGLSIGTLDDEWAACVEKGTSPPSARVAAHRALQDAGIATYGMACPVFPDQAHHVLPLLDALRIDRVEHVWCEPYNDRVNWRHVQASLPADSSARPWLDDVFANGRKDLWSDYAASLYETVAEHARRHGWTDKLRFLLYEEHVTAPDASRFGNLEGVLLQTKPDSSGHSKNPAFVRSAGGRE